MSWVGFLLLSLCLSILPWAGRPGAAAEELKISSPVFESNGPIPRRYSCDGKNVNPPLEVENVPAGARSLALILDDRDAPRKTFVHWILWNIDPKTKEIRENSVPKDAVEGTNDFKKQNYGGPCPPSGNHRYVFKVFALDTRPDLPPSARKPDLEKAMTGHILAQGQMTGTFKKTKP
jgi:Raf kinase inhibitor-like YbhB/YbcL family protein